MKKFEATIQEEVLPTTASISDLKESLRKWSHELKKIQGMKIDAWDALMEVRDHCIRNKLELRMPIMANAIQSVSVVDFGEHQEIDLLKRTNGASPDRFYWFEELPKGKTPNKRVFVNGFLMRCSFINQKGQSDVMRAIVICTAQEYELLKDNMKEEVTLEGMYLESSRNSMDRDKWFLANAISVQPVDYAGANNVLSKLQAWPELAPMRNAGDLDELFFDSDTTLCIMASAIFVRDGTAQFNSIIFGVTGCGKSSFLEYFCLNILGGTKESGTLASGKGWGVSHAKDARPSTLLVEKNMIYVNEFFKAVDNNEHTYALNLIKFLEKHMEIFERNEIRGSSGLGSVTGKMKAPFLSSENSDLNLKTALGRGFMMAAATFRRVQFLIVDRKIDLSKEVNSNLSKEIMTNLFKSKFGASALKDIRALYLYSRRFSENIHFEAPPQWRVQVRANIVSMLSNNLKLVYPDAPDWFSNSSYDQITRDKFAAVIDDMLNAQKDNYTACYVSAAIIRGWEVYDNIDDLKPHVDERQEEMAERMFKKFFFCKLFILAGGIQEYVLPDERIRK